MSTISFTNSVGYTRSFSTNELTIVITNLNATNSYYTNGLNDLLYVRVKEGYLLLFDLTDNINRKVFESFSIGYDASNPFSLKFTHNSTAIEYTVDNALISVGFSGTTPISTLESQYMKLYVTTSSLSYLTANDIVKDVGQHSVSPAEIKAFAGTNGIVLSNDANNFTISIDTNTYYNQTEVNNLLNGKQDTIADGDLTIAKTNGLQSALDGKQTTIADGDLTIAKTNGLQAALDAKQDTIADGDLTIAKTNGLQGELNLLTTNVASKVDSSLFTNVTNSLDTAILANEADILLKRNIADSYTKTEVQSFLNTKADSGDLLQINTTGTTYQQITHIAFSNGTTTTNSSLATVNITPAISDVVGLQTSLNGKVDNANAYPEIWTASNNTYARLPKLYFSNFEYPLQVGLNPSTEGYGAYRLKATPDLADVVGLGMVTTDSSNNFTLGHGLTIKSKGDAGTGERVILTLQDQNSTDYHYIATQFSTTTNVGNVLKFYLRDTNGSLQQAMQIRADKGMNLYGNLYVGQLLYVTTSATVYHHLYVSGNASASSFITTSDQSVKDDIKDIDLTPIFDNCNVKSYLRTDKPEWDRRVGFIAQDIQKSCTDNDLPNTFNNDIEQEDGTSILGLDYSRLVTVLWSKVKQLEQRIGVLEKS